MDFINNNLALIPVRHKHWNAGICCLNGSTFGFCFSPGSFSISLLDSDVGGGEPSIYCCFLVLDAAECCITAGIGFPGSLCLVERFLDRLRSVAFHRLGHGAGGRFICRFPAAFG